MSGREEKRGEGEGKQGRLKKWGEGSGDEGD